MAYAAACCLAGIGWFAGRRTLARIGVMIAVPAALGTVLAFWPRHLPCPLIATQDVVLRRGDGPSYPLAREAPVRPGEEGVCLIRRGAWVQAEFRDGSIGWLPASAVAVLDIGNQPSGAGLPPAP